ncbi:MAG: TonB-dependent receptor [Gemmatimonadetes bacterium]|nr:TonB-dependent receptor [Gemmatimonadota bacterium]
MHFVQFGYRFFAGAAALILLGMSASTYAADQIGGVVVDARTEDPLPGANVVIVGTRIGAVVDSEGRFTLKKICSGSITIRASMVGYLSTTSELDLDGDREKVVIRLDPADLRGREMVVTATRTEKHRRDVPVIVNIVDEKIFEDTQSETLADGVVFQPGLRVENNCQNCGFTQLRINGLEGGYSQILIDGRPIFSALDGVYGLEQIPTSMVEQIEVVRGGGSALYGGNAIAGTVNVITREAVNTGFDITASNAFVNGGTDDQKVSVSTSYVSDDQKAGISLFGLARFRSPYDHDGDGFSEIVKVRNGSFGMRSHLRPDPLSKLTFEFHTLNEDRRGGNRFEFEPHEADIAEWLEHKVVGGSLAYESVLSTEELHEFEFYVSAKRTARDSYYGAGRDPNAYGESLDRTVAVGGRYSKSLAATNDLTVGMDIKFSRLEDEIVGYQRFTDQSITTVGAYAQSDWKPADRVNFLLGARVDKHSLVEDPILSPRANLLLSLSEQSQIRLSGSSGYRAPQTFDEDLHIESVSGEALLIEFDPNLDTERSWSGSGSFDYSFSNPDYYWGFTLEGFYTRVTDAFVLEDNGQDAAGNFLLLKKNGDGTVVAGATLDLRASTWKTSFQAGLTLQSSRYDSPVEWADGLFSDRILRTPGFYGYYTASWKLTPVASVALSGTYTGPMDLPHYAGFIAEDRLERSDAFCEANATLDLDLELGGQLPELELKVGIKNLFNSYQNDFDRGIDRDAGYIYGPRQPRTIAASLKVVY